MPEQFNPLKVIGDDGDLTEAVARNLVDQILLSYHHEYDPIAEVVQNAVDACEHRFSIEGDGYEPEITITVNLQANCIMVRDNGVGMTAHDVRSYFFSPYATLKKNSPHMQRGEKGVGATYLAYSSSEISVQSRNVDTDEAIDASLAGGYDWVRGAAAAPLVTMTTAPDPDAPTGTTVSLTLPVYGPVGALGALGQTVGQWSAILRSKTALGSVDLDNERLFLAVLRATLLLVDESGADSEGLVEPGFLFPHRVDRAAVQIGRLARNNRGQLSEGQREMNVLYEFFGREQVLDAVQQRLAQRYTRNTVRRRITAAVAKYQPRVYIAFVDSADFWTRHNNSAFGAEIEGVFAHGIQFAVKHQPAGEIQTISLTSRTGDFNRFLAVIQLSNVQLDIGRKSLPEDALELGQVIVNGLRRKFFSDDDSLRPSQGVDEEAELAQEQLQDRAFERARIDFPGLHLTRVPHEEQDVVALFFDLLGMNHLKGFELYSTHIARTYDAVGRFFLPESPDVIYDPVLNRLGIHAGRFGDSHVVQSRNKAFLEFKLSTDGLVSDINAQTKRLADLKWLVCWSIGTTHEDADLSITEILEPDFINHREFYGVTHTISDGRNRAFIICLQTVLEYIVVPH